MREIRENIHKSGDDQERLFFQLNLVVETKILHKNKLKIKFSDNPNFKKKIQEYRMLKILTRFIIYIGILLFFMFVIIKIYYIFILIDLILVLCYYLYFMYSKIRYKNDLEINKRDLSFITEEYIKNKSFTIYQLIFEFLIVILSFSLLILSMLQIKPLIFILILIISITYVY